MRRHVAVVLVALLVAAGASPGVEAGAGTGTGAGAGTETGAAAPSGLAAPAVPPNSTDSADSTNSTGPVDAPALAGVYPNPTLEGDRGEFVLVSLPNDASNGTLSLGDDEARVSLATGRTGLVAFSTAPNATRRLVSWPVEPLDASLQLSNAGESLSLRRGNGTETVDTLAYADAPEGSLRRAGEWRPLGATDFAPVAVADVPVRAFVLPDAPAEPVAALRSAADRLLLAGYTVTSRRVADALLAAHARGVDVRVLVEGGPVGGVSERERRVLSRLARAGVSVTVLDGPRARYAFHHAKYAVVDDRVLVLTENWKPSGTGGHGNRGWGVVARSPRLADALARVFAADAGWADGRAWARYARTAEFVAGGPPANTTYPTRFHPATARADEVRLLVAPDAAEAGVVSLLRGAEESVLVEQVRVEAGTVFHRELLAAAERGVRVRVLVSGRWYVREANRHYVERLNRRAQRDGLPLRARLVEPRSRFEKVHAKGAVVDGERVVLGSLNWNAHSLRENREVALVVTDPAVGRYYARLFVADWRGGVWRLPLGLGGVALLAVGGAALAGRREIRFA